MNPRTANPSKMSVSDSDTTASAMESIQSSIKSLTAPELFKLLKLVAAEAEKKSKTTAKQVPGTKTAKTAKPKGAIPHQLLKPRAWVEYTLKDALANGWEAFTVTQTRKDKETGEKVEEEIEFPASILHDGAYIYEDSVSEAHPAGKQIIHKEAMSLSKQRKESNHPSYAAFEAQYVAPAAPEVASDSASETSATSSVKRVRKTAAEKEAEAAAKKEAKEREKEEKKAQKEREKEEKKAEKEREKLEKKAAADAEKAAKKTAAPSAAKLVPAAAVTRPVGAVSTSRSEGVKKVVVTKAAAAVVPCAGPKSEPVKKVKGTNVVAVETIPNDGMVHPWSYKGKKYLRNYEGETWQVGADGGVGAWAGLYDSASDKLDTTAAEPVFEDEE